MNEEMLRLLYAAAFQVSPDEIPTPIGTDQRLRLELALMQHFGWTVADMERAAS